MITHKDTPMHGISWKQNDPEYEPYVAYWKWTKRVYYLKGFPIWKSRINLKEHSAYELIR